MSDTSRRSLIKMIGASTVLGGIGTATATDRQEARGRIRKMGHSLLSDPVGEFTEEDIRNDGMYGVIGSFTGEGGSFLVDLRNPRDPREVHRLPSAADTRNADVAFDPRDGLYYRTQERNADSGETGFEVVDYGYDAGTPEDPVIVGKAEAGSTHNLFPHPEEPLVYACNEGPDEDPEGGLDIWDVSDPANPERVRETGPTGDLHDVVVDPDRDLAHLAYIGDGLDGYVVMDASNPRDPVEVGRVDYADRPDYTEIGEPGFENCHYADYDPERGLAVVGDELAFGIPGGKHIFDIGWGEGSPSDPVHLGFTHSPNAEPMDEGSELFDWTTHNHDVIPKGNTTLLVSGDYHEGTVVYDISDPTDPVPADQYRTDDKLDESSRINFSLGDPPAPMAWGANYNAQRDLVFTSDMVTGAYTFKVTPSRGRGNR